MSKICKQIDTECKLVVTSPGKRREMESDTLKGNTVSSGSDGSEN